MKEKCAFEVHILNITLTDTLYMPPFNRLLYVTEEMLVSELIFSLLIVIFCLAVYFKSREVYKLTEHRGAYFFSNAFLFFGLAYLTRLLFIIFVLYGSINYQSLSNLKIVILPSATFMTYFSSLAILSLTYSLLWRKLPEVVQRNFFLHMVAIAVTATAVAIVAIFKSPVVIPVFQLLLFALLILSAIVNYRSKERKRPFISEIYVVYFLLFAFWLVKLSSLIRPFELAFGIAINAISASIMAYIVYKVWRVLG